MATAIAGYELVGQRRTPAPPESLLDLWSKTTSAIVKYGFAIEYADLEAPRTGIFNGLKITIDPDVDFEMQCFILLHLFGHSVQWTAPALVSSYEAVAETKDKELFLVALHAYEYEAARLGMQLMRECKIEGLDQWFADFAHTDWTYVEQFYQTGVLPPWHMCVRLNQALVEPLSIPVIEHKEVEVRFAF